MGYIKKKYREMLETMDNRNYLPIKWQDFINQKSVTHNLIIKQGKECICTNCKHSFFSKKKANEKVKCPNCHQTYLIKRGTLKHYVFEDSLILLDRVGETLVARLFDMRSNYNNISRYYKFETSVVEYARFIPGGYYDELTFINDRVSRCQCYIHICHGGWNDPTKWRSYTRYYSLGKQGLVYPYNLKSLLKDTEYKYSMIWELVKHVNYVSIEELLKNSRYSQKIELLTKAKLYNLATNSEELNNTGSFEDRFGISQSFYPFMKRHNINYKELEMLRLLKEPNIKDIRYLLNYSQSHLAELSGYIKIKDFMKYAKSKRGKIDTYLYKDYLRFARILGFDLKNKKYAFPKNLKEEHDRLAKQVEINGKKSLNKAIARRYKMLSQNIFKDENYVIIPAKSVSALENESKQQNNCVRTYSEDYAVGKCDIYFLRKSESPSKSLVTIEVKHNRIVQSKARHNSSPEQEHLKVLSIWENKVLSKAA